MTDWHVELREARDYLSTAISRIDGVLKRTPDADLTAIRDALVAQRVLLGKVIEP
jgi:hypothetical protein